MNTSDILNKAADLIEENGWIRGSGWPKALSANPKLCLEGGIMAALDLKFDTVDLEEFWFCPAYRAVMRYLDRDEALTIRQGDLHQSQVEPLWEWNDDQADAEQVIATLRATALIEAAKENTDTRAAVTA